MKKFFWYLLLLPIFLSGQTRVLTQELLYNDLKNSSEVTMSFFSPENYAKDEVNLISLNSINVISEPNGFSNGQQLQFDITTDLNSLKNIIEILDNLGFLKSLYVRVDTCYQNLNVPNDIQCENDINLLIEIFFQSSKGYEQVFIPLNDKSTSLIVLHKISDLLYKKDKKIFNKLMNKIE